MNKRYFLIGLFICSIFFISNSCFVNADPTPKKKMLGIKDIFSHMEIALHNEDEKMFKALWHEDCYIANPSGSKGYSGKMVFEQGTKNGWYLKPNFKSILLNGLTEVIKSDDVVILPSYVWSVDKHKALKDIYCALVRHNEEWFIIGVSEISKDLEVIVDRFKNPWDEK